MPQLTARRSVMANHFETTGVAVTTTETDLQTVVVADAVSIGVRVSNTGAAAFTSFKIYAKFHPSDPAWSLLYSVAGDYTTPVAFLQACSTNMMVLANGASGWLTMDVVDMYSVKFTATCGTSTTAAVRGTAK